MRWMTLGQNRAERDRGATAIIVALVVPVVLLGLGAVVVDVGGWYVERAQTQNAADAGAVAVAQSCARGACTPSLATNYAPANSVGNLGATSQVTTGFPCGKEPTNVLRACPAGSEDGSICPTAPNKPYVNVLTNTAKNDGSGVPFVPRFLDQAFNVGKNPPTNNGYTKNAIGACAQATWGAPTSLGSAVAVTISACEWLENTNNGTTFAHVSPMPPSFLDTLAARKVANINFTNATDPNKETVSDDPPGPGATVAGSETVLTTHSLGNNPCAAGHPGWDEPGKFGWLSKKGAPCSVSIVNGQYDGSPGNAPADCNTVFNQSRDTKTPIFIPVYTRIDPTTGKYVLDGFAAFIVTGWDVQQANVFTPSRAPSVISMADGVTPASDANYCGKTYTGSSSDVCIYGYFTQALISGSDLPGGTGGGTNLGATAAFLTG